MNVKLGYRYILLASLIMCSQCTNEQHKPILEASARKQTIGELLPKWNPASSPFEVLESSVPSLGDRIPSIDQSCWLIEFGDARMIDIEVVGIHTKEEVAEDLRKKPGESRIQCIDYALRTW